MRKIAKNLHRAATTRRAMPQLWFDLMLVSGIAVPFSMWTQNYYMLLLAAGLEIIGVIWYVIGWVPVRKPVRRAQSVVTRTRRAPVRNGK